VLVATAAVLLGQAAPMPPVLGATAEARRGRWKRMEEKGDLSSESEVVAEVGGCEGGMGGGMGAIAASEGGGSGRTS
jgi:hypothetical protein